MIEPTHIEINSNGLQKMKALFSGLENERIRILKYLTLSRKSTVICLVLTLIGLVGSPHKRQMAEALPGDFDGPTVVSYTFSPTTIDISNSSADVVVTAHVTDASGVRSAPIIYIQNSAQPTATQQTGWFVRTSGTAQDGIYSKTITIPRGKQPGQWDVFSNAFFDTEGNDSGSVSPDNNQKLTVINTSVGDFDGPTVVSYTFSPTTIDISNSSADVVVTAHVTDASGVRSAPIIYIQNSAQPTATQQTGWFVRTSGTAQDGIYSKTITIPCGKQPGQWDVFSNAFFDTEGNDSGSVSPDNNQKLTVANTGGTCPIVTTPASSVPASSVPASSVPASSVPASSVPASSVPGSTAPVSTNPATSGSPISNVFTPSLVKTAESAPFLSTKKTASTKSLATYLGIKILSGSKVSLVVSANSRKICRVMGVTLGAIKKGTCRVVVTVTTRNGKKSSKHLSLDVRG